MKKLSVFLAICFVLAMSAAAMASEGVAGKTLKVNDTGCTVAFEQGPFGGGDPGDQSGTAMLTCGGDTIPMKFVLHDSGLTVYSSDYMQAYRFVRDGTAFKQVAPDGVQLSE